MKNASAHRFKHLQAFWKWSSGPLFKNLTARSIWQEQESATYGFWALLSYWSWQAPSLPVKFQNGAHFYPRPVLASGYYCCLCLCVCMYQSLACPHDNSSPVQARITKFGPEKQNTLVKIPIVLGGNWPWPSRSNLTSKLKIDPILSLSKPLVAAAARGSQDLTRRLTWGALGAKLNETTTLRPHISRTKWTDNMDFATRIQKNILSQHAKSWYSRENIVLLSVVLTWHLGTCIPAKKRMPN